MAKKTAKLSVKRETLRKLDALNEEQLRAVGGGTIIYQSGQCGGGIISSISTSRTDTTSILSFSY